MSAPGGRGFAYAGAALGGAVSIAANVAHSYVPPAGAAAGWRPEGGAVAGAVFWPVALFVAVEIFARVAWPAGRRWVALRYAGLLPVAAVAALVSYRHLSGLLAHYREDAVTVAVGPLAVDGLMVMAAAALIATARAVLPVPPGPRPAAETSHETSHGHVPGTSEDGRTGLVWPGGNSQPAAVLPPSPADGGQDRSGTDEDQQDRTRDRQDQAEDRAREPGASPGADDTDPLLVAGLAVLADLQRSGAVLTRAALLDGLRARDVKIGTGRATELLRQLRAAPADPVLNGSARPPGG